MAGAGRRPKPPDQRRNRAKPRRGEWTASASEGWQHGDIPETPEGLMPASVTAWDTWMRAWWAAHWTPDDLPALRQLIRLYDQVERGEFQRAGEVRLSMDTYGITPKGQQDRRWVRAEEEKPSQSQRQRAQSADPYGHLRVVND